MKNSLICVNTIRECTSELFLEKILDSLTHQRVLAVMDSSKGSRYKYSRGFGKWGHTEGLLGDWAKRLRGRLDAEHGRG